MNPTQATTRWAVIIPVYNEANAIAGTIDAVKKTLQGSKHRLIEIIVVNDGSTDGTADILAGASGVTVLTHLRNRGYGAALRTALDHSTQEWAAIIDSDGTYPVEQLSLLMGSAETQSYHMIVGSRRGEGINSAPFRRLARWVLRKVVLILTGTWVPDLNSGMRVFRRSLFQEFRNILPSGFSFTTTITVASIFCGYQVLYVPIEYAKRTGKSHILPVRDFTNFLILISRITTYFDPLKFFIPLALVILILGLGKGVRDFFLVGYIGSLSVIMILMSLQVFLTGILADVMAKKGALTPTTSALTRTTESPILKTVGHS